MELPFVSLTTSSSIHSFILEMKIDIYCLTKTVPGSMKCQSSDPSTYFLLQFLKNAHTKNSAVESACKLQYYIIFL